MECTHHENDLFVLWIQGKECLEAWNVKKAGLKMEFEFRCSEPCLSFAVLESTNRIHSDILILDTNHNLLLKTYEYGNVSLRSPIQAHSLTSTKRRRDSLETENDSIDPFSTCSLPIIGLLHPVGNRVNLLFSNGKQSRATFDFMPPSTLVSYCLYALKDVYPLQVESLIVKRFWITLFGKKNSNCDFQILIETILSLVSDLPKREQNVSEKSSAWEILQNQPNVKFPKCVLDSFKKSKLKFSSESYVDILLSKANELKSSFHGQEPLLLKDLKSLVLKWHLIYESISLQVFSKQIQNELGKILCILSSMNGMQEYMYYYLYHGIEFDSSLLHILNQESDDSLPFDSCQWILNCISTRTTVEDVDQTVFSHIFPKHLHRCIPLLSNVLVFYTTLYKYGKESMILEMVHRNFALMDLQQLPFGVALGLQEALFACKSNPPDNWPIEAYELIERQDLAQMLKNPLDISTPFSPLPNYDSMDMSQLYDSSLSSENTLKQQDKDFSIQSIVSKLRFNKDDRLQRVTDMLDSSKIETISYDLPPESR